MALLEGAELASQLERYVRLANAFYEGLESDEKATLRIPSTTVLRSFVGEMLLLMHGLKPCVLVCPYYPTKDLAGRLVESAIKPAFQDVEDLEICEVRGGLTQGTVDFTGQWLVRNRRHADYAASAFLVEGSTRVASMTAIGRALGYPVSGNHELNCTIEYMHGPHEDDCALEYMANLQEDPPLFLRHFVEARNACRPTFDLKLRLGGKEILNYIVDAIDGLEDDLRKRATVSGIAFWINNSTDDKVVGERSMANSPFDVRTFVKRMTDPSLVPPILVRRMQAISGDHQRIFDDVVYAISDYYEITLYFHATVASMLDRGVVGIDGRRTLF